MFFRYRQIAEGFFASSDRDEGVALVRRAQGHRDESGGIFAFAAHTIFPSQGEAFSGEQDAPDVVVGGIGEVDDEVTSGSMYLHVQSRGA